jgi:hypothetical protein
MQDLGLNSNFSVHLDDRNDLATVEGREAFEQSVVMMLTDFMYDTLPGLSRRKTIEQRIQLEVTRVAREHDLLENITRMEIREKPGTADTYQVEVVYEATDAANFQEEFTAQ